MNRRQFLRSGAIFSIAVAAAPSLALTPTIKEEAVADYAGCPGYEVILADLIVGFRNVFPDAELAAYSSDMQFLSFLAHEQCDMLCAASKIYAAFSPVTATGVELDRLSRIVDGPIRGWVESDETFRARILAIFQK